MARPIETIAIEFQALAQTATVPPTAQELTRAWQLVGEYRQASDPRSSKIPEPIDIDSRSKIIGFIQFMMEQASGQEG